MDIETLNKIEAWLNKRTLPKKLRISQSTVITDCEKFVKASLMTCKSNIGNDAYLPYFDRLKLFCEKLLEHDKSHRK